MNRRRKRFPIRRCAAVDVDGTLLINGELNQDLREWIEDKKEKRIELILWSARGRDYALRFAEKFEIEHLFDAIISKPGVIVDDKGWGWIEETQVIRI
jgi:hydroxymethylpyrimidine pyrophosphatase-like HAD family hydrolase